MIKGLTQEVWVHIHPLQLVTNRLEKKIIKKIVKPTLKAGS